MPPADRKKRQLLFLLKFIVSIAVLYFVIALRPVDRSVVTPFSRGVAATSTAVLNLFGQHAVQLGTVIQGDRFAVDIKNGCNGLEALLLVICAIGSFPAPAIKRLWGVLAAAMTLQAVNIVRVVSLFIIGRDHPAVFEAAHVTVWQSLMFLVSIGLFVLWSSRVAPRSEVTA